MEKERKISLLEKIVKLLGETPGSNEKDLKELERRLRELKHESVKKLSPTKGEEELK